MFEIETLYLIREVLVWVVGLAGIYVLYTAWLLNRTPSYNWIELTDSNRSALIDHIPIAHYTDGRDSGNVFSLGPNNLYISTAGRKYKARWEDGSSRSITKALEQHPYKYGAA